MSDTYLLVEVQSERYALPIGQVVEVARLGQVAPLPGAPAGVLGLQNLRGQPLPVLDLASLTGAGEAGAAEAVVLVEDGGRRACLGVNALLDVAVLDEQEAQVEEGPLRSSVLVDGALVGVLDIQALFARVK